MLLSSRTVVQYTEIAAAISSSTLNFLIMSWVSTTIGIINISMVCSRMVTRNSNLQMYPEKIKQAPPAYANSIAELWTKNPTNPNPMRRKSPPKRYGAHAINFTQISITNFIHCVVQGCNIQVKSYFVWQANNVSPKNVIAVKRRASRTIFES